MMHKKYGFTFIEVLIVLAIIGILLSVAIPEYKKHQDEKVQHKELNHNINSLNETHSIYNEYKISLDDNFIGFSDFYMTNCFEESSILALNPNDIIKTCAKKFIDEAPTLADQKERNLSFSKANLIIYTNDQ